MLWSNYGQVRALDCYLLVHKDYQHSLLDLGIVFLTLIISGLLVG